MKYQIAVDYCNNQVGIFIGFQDQNTIGRVNSAAAQSRINRNWILLDNQANVNVFANAHLLTNIRSVSGSMTIHGNGGSTAEDIFGPNLGSLKGKTPRRAGEPVTVAPLLPLPIEIMDRYRAIILAIDIMFVNKIPFFMSISRNLRFGTAERIGNRQASTLSTAVRHIHQVYLKRGFQITTVLGDNEFDKIRGDLATMRMTLNTVAADEHVPEIERYIRTVKDRSRSVYNTLPLSPPASSSQTQSPVSLLFLPKP